VNSVINLKFFSIITQYALMKVHARAPVLLTLLTSTDTVAHDISTSYDNRPHGRPRPRYTPQEDSGSL